jgi:drug/metabolite transporter (DMT)-like permease
MSSTTETRTNATGVVLVIASAALFAVAGTFTKAITAPAWTIACWRGAVGALVIVCYLLLRDRKRRLRERFHLGRGGWLIAIVGAFSSIAFIAAFKMTYVANVTVIYATVPFIAAGLEWLIAGAGTGRRTLLTAFLSLAGVFVMAAGGWGSGGLTGDLFAFLMTVGCALYMVLIRRFRDTSAVWAAAVSALILFAASWLLTNPVAISARDAWLTLGFGVSFGLAVILWTEGTMLIPAAESGLLGTSELPLAVIFAWLLIGEVPPFASVAGGVIVLLAVFCHAAGDILLRRGRKAASRRTAEITQP